MQCKWRLPQAYLELAKNEVHIWQANLEISDELAERFKTALSLEELDKGHRFIKKTHQARYIAAHGILRNILSRYLQVLPQEIQFGKGKYGKPFLVFRSIYKENNIEFNMSHTENLVLYAIAKGTAVGIDIEKVNKHTESYLAIAKRFFHPEEYKQLISLPEIKRHKAFYQLWTCKEAFIKATGEGMHRPLNRFMVNITSQDEACLLSVDQDVLAAKKWFLSSLHIDEHHEAALVVEGDVRRFCCYKNIPR